MRSFVSLSLLLSLSLASTSQAKSPSSPPSLPRDVVDVHVDDVARVLPLRRANADEDVSKQSDLWSWREKGKTCYCRPDDVYEGGYFPGTDANDQPSSGKGKPSTGGSGSVPSYPSKDDSSNGHTGHKSQGPSSAVDDAPHATVTSSPNRKPGKGSHRHHKPGNHHGDKTHGSRPASPSLPQDPKPAPSSDPSSLPVPSSPSSPDATSKKTCPSGYKYASKGDTFLYNDNSLVDASNVDLSIDILSFLNPSSAGQQSSVPAKGSPQCQTECCCYRTTPTPKTSCPSGYTRYSQGDSVVENEHSLVDLSHLSISLDILSFASNKGGPLASTAPAQDKPTCSAKTCCVKQTTKEGSSVISNHGSLINASGAKVNVCLLTLCA